MLLSMPWTDTGGIYTREECYLQDPRTIHEFKNANKCVEPEIKDPRRAAFCVMKFISVSLLSQFYNGKQ
jgi:hypothetical protein